MGIRRRSVIGLLVAVLATLTVLTGCTDDRERPSSTLPPLNSSSSATPTPTDAPGAEGYPLPEEAREYTAEAARAFIDYFVAVTNDALATGNSDPLREISLPACEDCSETAQLYDDNAANGLTVIGGEFVITGGGNIGLTEEQGVGAVATQNLIMLQTPSQVLDDAGVEIFTSPQLNVVGTIQIVWDSLARDWKVYLFATAVQ